MEAGAQVRGTLVRRSYVFAHLVLELVGSHQARIVGIQLQGLKLQHIPFRRDVDSDVKDSGKLQNRLWLLNNISDIPYGNCYFVKIVKLLKIFNIFTFHKLY